MTPRGRALASVVLVALALGLGAGVTAADDVGTQDDVTVHLVGDDDEDDGLDTIALFAEAVPETYDIEYIDVADVDLGVIDETDIFVFYDTDEDEALITIVEDDPTTGAVYLDQQDVVGSNAVPDRSAVVGDPEETDDDSTFDVVFDVQVEHPIFRGVANASETVPIGVPGEFIDYAWFEGADGETLAEVGEDGEETDGGAVAVDPESGSVLLSGVAVQEFAEADQFTEAANQTLANAVEFAEPDTGEPFFVVSDLDAPAVAPTGADIDVNATVTNVGTETGTQDVEFVLDDETVATGENITLDPGGNVTVGFEPTLPEEIGVFEHGVFTDDDGQTAEIRVGDVENVGVVEDQSQGANTAALFADELPNRFAVDVVGSEDVVEDDLVEFFDILVFHDFSFGDDEEIIPAVENDVTTGAVYLDQEGFTSNAIPDRSDLVGDPESTAVGPFAEGPMEYELLQAEHPIFDGIDAPDGVFEIHAEDEIAWFEGADGETLAEVTDDSGEVGGSAVAVDPESGSVLLASIATQVGLGPSQFTEAANQTLANAVAVAEPDIEEPFFEVGDLDAPAEAGVGTEIDVSATITNIGNQTDTQDIEFVLDNETVDTDENITLDPDEATTVTFEDIPLPEEGVFEHGVFTDEDSQTADIAVVVGDSFFAVSGLDAPAEAGAGEQIDVSATITNTGNVTGTQTVAFILDGEGVATEPDVTLAPDEGEPVTFEPTLPEEGGVFEHGVFTDDDNETAEISVTNPPEIELSDLDIAGEGENATVLEADHEVSTELTHVGGGAGEVETTLKIGDTVEETTTVDIAENETTGVTFENVTTGLGPGIYEVEITAQDETRTGELTVSVDVVGNGDPATDTTGDGLLDDLTGDGQSGIEDVQTLFESLDSDAIQDNVELFDFLGDDRVTIFDVQALFTDLEWARSPRFPTVSVATGLSLAPEGGRLKVTKIYTDGDRMELT